jgi:hypothetical protein
MKTLILASLITVFLTGCLTVGRKIDVTKFDDIVTCSTTRTELISLLGEPYKEGVKKGYTKLKYVHEVEQFLSGRVTSNYAIFLLNNKNVVVDYEFNPEVSAKLTDSCKG